jgi:DNA-binding transcriptional LysR family regulator
MRFSVTRSSVDLRIKAGGSSPGGVPETSYVKPCHGAGRTASAQDLLGYNCINLRLPTYGGLFAWEFEKDGRELNVRVEGQLVFNRPQQMLTAALVGFGLAYMPEDIAQPHLARGRLERVVRRNGCPESTWHYVVLVDSRAGRSSVLPAKRRRSVHLLSLILEEI